MDVGTANIACRCRAKAGRHVRTIYHVAYWRRLGSPGLSWRPCDTYQVRSIAHRVPAGCLALSLGRAIRKGSLGSVVVRHVRASRVEISVAVVTVSQKGSGDVGHIDACSRPQHQPGTSKAGLGMHRRHVVDLRGPLFSSVIAGRFPSFRLDALHSSQSPDRFTPQTHRTRKSSASPTPRDPRLWE